MIRRASRGFSASQAHLIRTRNFSS